MFDIDVISIIKNKRLDLYIEKISNREYIVKPSLSLKYDSNIASDVILTKDSISDFQKCIRSIQSYRGIDLYVCKMLDIEPNKPYMRSISYKHSKIFSSFLNN